MGDLAKEIGEGVMKAFGEQETSTRAAESADWDCFSGRLGDVNPKEHTSNLRVDAGSILVEFDLGLLPAMQESDGCNVVIHGIPTNDSRDYVISIKAREVWPADTGVGTESNGHGCAGHLDHAVTADSPLRDTGFDVHGFLEDIYDCLLYTSPSPRD